MFTALIIEDSLTERKQLTHYLQQSGINVLTAESTEEAVILFQDRLPDLVLLDIVLPGQSGFEFCRTLKTTKQTQAIPVVLCSSKSTEADRLWGEMLGADAHLSKPVDQQQLTATIQQFFH